MKGRFLFVCIVLFLVSSILSPWGKAQELHFTILHTNDEHSALIPKRTQDLDTVKGGISRLATAIKHLREKKAQEDQPLLLLSGGDFLGGTPFSWLLLRGLAPELMLMQQLGYDVITIGNHEFDYGPDLLANYFFAAGYPRAWEKTVLLSSNLEAPAGHPLLEVGIKKTYLKELENGLTVGFLGLLGQEAYSLAPLAKEMVFLHPHDAAKEYVNSLKRQGADVIIAITHAGLEEDRELAKEVPGIHLIVGGHCHTPLKEPELVHNTILVQAGSSMEYLGILELSYHKEKDALQIQNYKNNTPFLMSIDDSIAPHQEIEESLNYFSQELNQWINSMTNGEISNIKEGVAYSHFSLAHSYNKEEHPVGNFIVDAMRLAGGEQLGVRVDVAFQATGMIRDSINPDPSKETKNIDFYSLVVPISIGIGSDDRPGTSLVAFYLTGKEVYRVLEINVFLSIYLSQHYFFQVSGLRYTYDPKRASYLTIPIKGIPIPSGRAVLKAQLYTGEGIQEEGEEYLPLNLQDDNLYLVVCDAILLSFLPMVGEVLPRLNVVPKDQDGKPYENLEETIIYLHGEEYKVWQAVVHYALNLPYAETKGPEIPLFYREPQGRITTDRGIPFVVWPLLGLLLLLTRALFF